MTDFLLIEVTKNLREKEKLHTEKELNPQKNSSDAQPTRFLTAVPVAGCEVEWFYHAGQSLKSVPLASAPV